MPLMATEFSVQPFAIATADTDAIDAILTSLEAHPRVIAPAVGFDHENDRVDAIFQVELADRAEPHLAVRVATHAFDDALHAAGLDVRTEGVAVVHGSDPDLLP